MRRNISSYRAAEDGRAWQQVMLWQDYEVVQELHVPLGPAWTVCDEDCSDEVICLSEQEALDKAVRISENTDRVATIEYPDGVTFADTVYYHGGGGWVNGPLYTVPRACRPECAHDGVVDCQYGGRCRA